MQSLILISLVALLSAAPIPDEYSDEFLGLAWEAAAGSVNAGNHGKYLVPTELLSGSRTGKVTTLKVIYQASWCSPDNGNDLEDVCEAMCPIFEGGEKYTYEVVATEDEGGNTFTARRLQ